ncbi:hypothetical protein EXIGLDRAFT_756517 [Exidia glandulosa HHB12029]|uniref:F-box domain-containing protein n=1 Tax=Exidia glandulosa HHB12029 TaxID=1314781 RepID=A0A165B8B8_EXIGL|nr:hypothetical protein EXIGLDRAFT_756517 [Exidia glandulosa HHB12029]
MTLPETTTLSTTQRDELVKLVRSIAIHLRRPDYDLLVSDVEAIARCVVDSIQRPPQLPPELLCSIMSWLSFKDIVSASSTCRSWREAILEDARLWATITVDYQTGLTPLALFIERAKSLPLDLALRIPAIDLASSDDMLELPRLLRTHLARISALAIRMTRTSILVDGLPQALSASASILQRCTIRIIDDPMDIVDDGDPVLLPSDVFAGQAPKLTEIYMKNVAIPAELQWSAFASLRKFLFTGPASVISPSTLYDIILHCPHLEHLAAWFRPHDDMAMQLLPRPQLPHRQMLKTMRLDCVSRTGLGPVALPRERAILHCLHPETETQLSISCSGAWFTNDPLPLQSISVLPPKESRRGAASALEFDVHCFGQASTAYRGACGLNMDHAAFFLARYTSMNSTTITELVVPSVVFCRQVMPFHFPGLNSLSIILDHRHVVFSNNNGRLLGLRSMTGLETLRFAKATGARGLSSEVAVDAGAVIRCFETYRTGMQRIGRLVLCGIRTMLTSEDVSAFVEEVIHEEWSPPTELRFKGTDEEPWLE